MVQTENYILTKNVLNLIKKNPDFKGRTFRKWLYTNTIMFEFIINVDGTKWDYQILDDCNKSLYCSYYNREYGKNELVERLDNSVVDILNELIDKGILKRKGDK